jgi:hypothetical protein
MRVGEPDSALAQLDQLLRIPSREGAIPKSDETLIYELAQDEQGNLVLKLRYPDSGFSAFYPQGR